MRLFKAAIATLSVTAGTQYSRMGPEQQKKLGTQPTAREVKNDAFLTPDSPSLLDASRRNQLKISSLEQDTCADPFSRTLLRVQDGHGRNAMTIAAQLGQVAVISEFLKSEDGRTLLMERDIYGWNAMTRAAHTVQVSVIRESVKSEEGRELLYMSLREAWNDSVLAFKVLVGVLVSASIGVGLILLVPKIKHLVNRLDDLYNLTRLATRTLRTATENALDETKTSEVKKGLFDFYILKRRINGEPVGPRLQIVGIPNLNEQEQQAIKDIYARCLTFPDFKDTCFISYEELNDGREIGLHGNSFVGLASLGEWIAADNHSEKRSPPGLKEGLVFGPDQLLIEAQNPLIGNHSGGF